MPTFVDSCVLLDIFTQDPKWFRWSATALEDAANMGAIIMNPVVYAEVSSRFSTIEALDAELPAHIFAYRPVPPEAAFLAGKCYAQYRRRSGTKLSPLPDFFIGAHAAVAGLPLLTRDPRRFREYFPTLNLICP